MDINLIIGISVGVLVYLSLETYSVITGKWLFNKFTNKKINTNDFYEHNFFYLMLSFLIGLFTNFIITDNVFRKAVSVFIIIIIIAIIFCHIKCKIWKFYKKQHNIK